jgi:NAD(P)-dependent dehydrogenase (short-subunit alcohol dehydrogenase family)
MRTRYNHILNTNLTSVAVLTHAFTPLLHCSRAPRVINISSGLGSMTNALTRKMGRAPAYGASKVGLNGLSVHLQVEENDRIEAGIAADKPRIETFVVAPGLLKTAFTNFLPGARDPLEGAEVVVRLALDREGEFEGGSFVEWEGGELKRVPW